MKKPSALKTSVCATACGDARSSTGIMCTANIPYTCIFISLLLLRGSSNMSNAMSERPHTIMHGLVSASLQLEHTSIFH